MFLQKLVDSFKGNFVLTTSKDIEESNRFPITLWGELISDLFAVPNKFKLVSKKTCEIFNNTAFVWEALNDGLVFCTL